MDETKNYHQELIETMDTPEIVRKRMEHVGTARGQGAEFGYLPGGQRYQS